MPRRRVNPDGTEGLTPNEEKLLRILKPNVPQPIADIQREMSCNATSTYRALKALADRGLVRADWWVPDDAFSPSRPRRLYYLA